MLRIRIQMRMYLLLFFLLTISVITAIACFLFLSFSFSSKSKSPLFVYRIHDDLDVTKPSLSISETFKVVIQQIKDKVDVEQTDDFSKANLLIFQTLNHVDQNIQRLYADKNINLDRVQYIFGICGTDYLVSKSVLAYFVKQSTDPSIIPESFILGSNNDMLRLHKTFSESEVYIMKKNIQRQQGIIMTQSLDEIIQTKNENEKDYVIAQKMLQNPLLIDKHKINLRIYLLVIITPKECTWQIYDNGFVYYTPKHFIPFSKDHEHVITSGYIDRSIYERNPMTLKEVHEHLGDQKFDVLFGNIKELFRVLKETYSPIFIEKNEKSIKAEKTVFSLFGCDIAPSDDLKCKLMEVNKGPDLNFKDEKDGKVKVNLVKDMFGKVGIVPNSEQDGFIRI